jgi:hypothetical protein
VLDKAFQDKEIKIPIKKLRSAHLKLSKSVGLMHFACGATRPAKTCFVLPLQQMNVAVAPSIGIMQ